jgi:hypothetical protein
LQSVGKPVCLFGLAKLKAPVAADVRRLTSKSGEKSEPPTPKMRPKETLALTPALSPRRGRSIHSARKFSYSVARPRLMGTHVGCYDEGKAATIGIDASTLINPATTASAFS